MTKSISIGFRRSSFCGGGNCVEVAPQPDGSVALRDSKERQKPVHTFTRDEWVAFVRGVKAGEFDFDTDDRDVPGR